MIVPLIILVSIISILLFKLITKPSEATIEIPLTAYRNQKREVEEFAIKKTLISQFKDYLIKLFRDNAEIHVDVFQEKISKDFPNYGNGLLNEGLFKDLVEYNLINYSWNINEDYNMDKIVLGKTFNIIRLIFPNFVKFYQELIGPVDMNYDFRRYNWNQPDTYVFNQDLKKKDSTMKFTFRFGILTGSKKEFNLDSHLSILEPNKKYLTTQLYHNGLLYFDYFELSNDLNIEKYRDLHNESVKKAQNHINDLQLN